MTDSDTEYRIEYSIQRRLPNEGDFAEIGFGSSGSASSIDDACFALESYVANYQWETTPGMPDPDEIKDDIAGGDSR